MFFSDDRPLSGVQLAALEEHELVREWVAETLEDLPDPNDPWIEMAPVVTVLRAALDEAERMLRSSRSMIELGEITVARQTASELCAIARTVQRQLWLLGELLNSGGSEIFSIYIGLCRAFVRASSAYEEALFGGETPF